MNSGYRFDTFEPTGDWRLRFRVMEKLNAEEGEIHCLGLAVPRILDLNLEQLEMHYKEFDFSAWLEEQLPARFNVTVDLSKLASVQRDILKNEEDLLNKLKSRKEQDALQGTLAHVYSLFQKKAALKTTYDRAQVQSQIDQMRFILLQTALASASLDKQAKNQFNAAAKANGFTDFEEVLLDIKKQIDSFQESRLGKTSSQKVQGID